MADNASGIKAGRAYVELGANDAGLRAGLAAASAQLKAFGAGIAAIGASFLGLGAAILAPLLAASKVFSDVGSDLLDMSQRTGVSVEALSELGFAADQSGSSIEELEGGLRKMQQALGNAAGGSKEAAKSFEDLGLNIQDLIRLTPDQQFLEIAHNIGTIEDPTRRTAAAMDIFGKAGTKLLPLFSGGKEGIDELIKRARELGLVMSTEDAMAAEQFGDTMDQLWKTLKRSVVVMGGALVPVLQQVTEWLITASASVGKFIAENKELIVIVASVGAGLVAAGVGLIALGATFSAIGFAIGALTPIIAGVGAVLKLWFNPMVMITREIIFWAFAWRTVVAAAQTALAKILEVATSVFDWIGGWFSGLADMASAAWEGVASAALSAINFVGNLFSVTADGATISALKWAAGIGVATTALVALGKATGLLGVALPAASISFAGLTAILSGAAGLITSGFAMAATFIGAMFSPLALVAGAIAAIGAGLISFHWEAVSGAAQAAFQRVSSAGQTTWQSLSNAAQSTFDFFGQLFGDMQDTALSAWDGIKEAIGTGDLVLAAQIAWSGLKVEFQIVADAVKGQWQDFITWWESVTVGAAMVINDLWTDLQSGFGDAVDAMKDIWTAFRDFVRNPLQAQTIRPEAFNEGWQGGMRPEALNQGPGGGIREEFLTQPGMSPEAAREIEARAAERRARDARIRNERDARNQGLQNQLDNLQRPAPPGEAPRISPELANARRELNDALIDAAEAAANAWVEADARRKKQASQIDIPKIADKVESKGTFSAFAAIRGLGAESLAQRTASATEKTATEIERLREEERRREDGLTAK